MVVNPYNHLSKLSKLYLDARTTLRISGLYSIYLSNHQYKGMMLRPPRALRASSLSSSQPRGSSKSGPPTSSWM